MSFERDDRCVRTLDGPSLTRQFPKRLRERRQRLSQALGCPEFIQSDLNELRARLQRLASIVAVVLAGALGIALLMTARLRRVDLRTH